MATTASYSVPGISCQHCVDAITAEVAKVAGVIAVNIDLDTKTVSVAGGNGAAIVAAIDEAGYDIA